MAADGLRIQTLENELVESPIQEQRSFWDHYKRFVRYLYDRTRVQFQPALYVLVYAATFIAMLHAAHGASSRRKYGR